MLHLHTYTKLTLMIAFMGWFAISGFSRMVQPPPPKDTSLIQLYGVVMTADSLKAIPSASIIILGKNRGTITNEQGVFSIVVNRGDRILISSVGYKDKSVLMPMSLKSNQYSIIQLMVNDTSYLPATVLQSLPTREQFERDFVNYTIPDDAYEIARQNIDEDKRNFLLRNLPEDGREAVSFQLQQQATRYYYAGQLPPIQLLNPAAWSEFVKSWKRGDFKKPSSTTSTDTNTDIDSN